MNQKTAFATDSRMTERDRIRLAMERSEQILQMRPSVGKRTGTSTTRIREGLICEIEEGNWKFLADMPVGIGGYDSAPKPGVYGRAALGSCLAIVYMMRSIKMNIPLRNLEVEVQTDFDDAGLLGLSDSYPGYSEVRYKVTIESDASEEEILMLLDDADQHSPYLDIFTRSLMCKREVNIVCTKK